jgi:acyl carrier protein
MTDAGEQSIEQVVARFVCDQFGLSGTEFQIETPLFSSRLLRSLDLVEIVLFVEERYGLDIVSLDVGIEQMDTILNIAAFIRSQIARIKHRASVG